MRTGCSSPPNTAQQSSVAFSGCADGRHRLQRRGNIALFRAALTMEQLSLKDGRMATPPFRPRSA